MTSRAELLERVEDAYQSVDRALLCLSDVNAPDSWYPFLYGLADSRDLLWAFKEAIEEEIQKWGR